MKFTDKTRQNIIPTGFFHTPKSMDELMNYLEGLTGNERAIATTCAMMAWNLAASIDKQNREKGV